MKSLCSLSLLILGLNGFVFALEPADVSPTPALTAGLQVEVLSSLEKPVPAARVRYYASKTMDVKGTHPCRSYEGIEAEAVSESLFSKDLAPGSYRVEVTAEGWQGEMIKEVKLEEGEKKNLKVRLEPGNVIAGRVVDESGSPLPGAGVKYYRTGASTPWFLSASHDEETDGDGRFRLGSLREGIYNLTVSLPGYVDASVKDVATGEENLEVALKRGFVIKGKLTGDTASLGEQVRLRLKKSKWGTSSKKVDLGAGNTFAITDLDEETYSIRLQDGDYISDWARNVRAASPEAAVPVTLSVHKGGSLSGKVINSRDGTPLSDAQTKLTPAGSRRGQYKSSDQEGKFDFSALEPGDYELEVRLRFDSYSDWRLRKTVSISAGEEISGFDVEIDPGRGVSFSGMAVDEEGKPVADAEIKVHARRPDDKRYRSGFREMARTDGSGYFSFSTFLDGEREIKLTAEKDGYSPARSEKYALAADRNSLDGITLRLGKGSTLRVEVVDEKGVSVPRAKVELKRDWSADRESVSYFSTRKKLTDARGICRFELLPPNQYRLEVEKKGYAPTEEKPRIIAAEQEKAIRVELEEGRILRVMVKNSAGDPVAGAEVTARPARGGFVVFVSGSHGEKETDPAGYCLVDDLPREPLLVGVEAEGYVPVRRQRVEEDEDEVEIVLEGGGSIRGRLLAPGGEEVKEMEIRPRRHREDPFDFSSEGFTSSKAINLGEGDFRIGELREGTYSLRIKVPGLAVKKVEDVEVKLGEETDVGKIKLGEEGTITGVILKSEDNSPLDDVWVRLEGEEVGRFVISDRTDNKGGFTLENIPAGTYTVVARQGGRREKEVSGISVSAGEDKKIETIRLEELTEAEKAELEKNKNLIPSLGIRIGEMGASRDFAGLSVGEVLPGSAAGAAGIKSGDTIIKVNGKGLWEDPSTFLRGIMGKPGTQIKVTVKRKDSQKEEEVDLTIGEWDYEEMLKTMQRH